MFRKSTALVAQAAIAAASASISPDSPQARRHQHVTVWGEAKTSQQVDPQAIVLSRDPLVPEMLLLVHTAQPAEVRQYPEQYLHTLLDHFSVSIDPAHAGHAVLAAIETMEHDLLSLSGELGRILVRNPGK